MQSWEYCRLYVEFSEGEKVRIGFQRFDKRPEEITRTTETSQLVPLVEFYAKMAELGEQGWELVDVDPDGQYLFKRPLERPLEPVTMRAEKYA